MILQMLLLCYNDEASSERASLWTGAGLHKGKYEETEIIGVEV